MKRHVGMFIVNGTPIEAEYGLVDGNVMVPVLFFKHTGVAVDVNVELRMTYFHTESILLGVYHSGAEAHYFLKQPEGFNQGVLKTPLITINGRSFVSLSEIGKIFAMKIWTEDQLAAIHVCTNLYGEPTLYFSGNSAYNQVALSFDDGPDEGYTPKVLDILKEKQVKATFFVVGQQVKWFPDMLQRVIAEGHEIGNHSFSHPEFSEVTTSELIREIKQTNEEIFNVSGIVPAIMRPPFGDIPASDAKEIDKLGLKIMMWSVDTQDWKGVSAKRIIHKVMSETRPGSVVLKHSLDCMPLDGMIEALPVIIDRLREQGYQFVTMSEMKFQ